MEMKDGLLLVEKDPGFTSHDVVQRVRRILKQKKIGHCGTLDPDATGLLLLTLAMFHKAGAATGDSEGLIDTLRSIAGVEAVALIREREDGSQKVSLRSRGEVDVEKIARHHGGGGHKNAAGYSLEGKDGEAIRLQVAAELGAALS